MDFAKFAVEKRTGCGPVPSPTELPCQLVAIDMAAGAEADFEATLELFDEDHCDLGPLDGQGQVDRIFGVAGKCPGFGKVLLANIRVDQLTVALVGRAGKNSTAQSDSSDRIAFVQIAVDRRWGCSLIDQLGDHSVGRAGRRVETEPTGIRGDRRIERIGHRFGDGDLGMLGAEGHQMAGRLGAGVLEKLGPEVILADMVVDDDFTARETTKGFGHGAELRPGACVQDDQTIAGDLLEIDTLTQYADVLPWVQEREGRRGRMPVDDSDLLAQTSEHTGHSDFATDRIAIGSDVAREDKTLVRTKDRNQPVPG